MKILIKPCLIFLSLMAVACVSSDVEFSSVDDEVETLQSLLPCKTLQSDSGAVGCVGKKQVNLDWYLGKVNGQDRPNQLKILWGDEQYTPAVIEYLEEKNIAEEQLKQIKSALLSKTPNTTIIAGKLNVVIKHGMYKASFNTIGWNEIYYMHLQQL